MSQFIDRLNGVSTATPRAMGFKTARITESAKAKPLLIAGLAQFDGGGTDYIAGADAVLLNISNAGAKAPTLKRPPGSAPEIPWGGWLKDANSKQTGKVVKSGFDFMVFSLSSPALSIAPDSEIGKILKVAPSLSDGLLMTINQLPVDAIFISEGWESNSAFTWHHLMTYQHFADMVAKPLIVAIPPKSTAKELQALWNAGVDAVVIAVEDEKASSCLKKLRLEVDKLTFDPRNKPIKTPALLGNIASTIDATDEEESEDITDISIAGLSR
ncbi:hypothetical protein ACFLU4_05710 [Chloroflexota bacterium]